MAKVPFYLDVKIKPHLVSLTSSFGYGAFTQMVRKRSALMIEKMLVHRLEYVRAVKLVDLKRRKRRSQRDTLLVKREAFIAKRVESSITIQRIFRGFSARIIHCAANQARIATHRLLAAILNTSWLYSQIQAVWKAHKGFLGKINLGSYELLTALGHAGHLANLKLQPEGVSLDDPSQALVGGRVSIFMSLERYLGPTFTVLKPRQSNLTIRDVTNNALHISFCTHHSVIRDNQRLAAPTIIKVQLAGMYEVVGQTKLFSSTRRFCCDVFLYEKLTCSTTRLVRPKAEPCFYDEILYVSLRDCPPHAEEPFLRFELFEYDEHMGLSDIPTGEVSLGLIEFMKILGTKAVKPLTGSWDDRLYYLAFTLSMEEASRTESRVLVESIVADLLKGVRRELDNITPRVELHLLETRILGWKHIVDSNIYKDMWCEVYWNGALHSSTSSIPAKYSQSWAHLFCLEHPEGFPPDKFEVAILLKADNKHGSILTLASAKLRHKDLYVPEGCRRCLNLFEHLDTKEIKCIGTAEVEITSKYTSKPHWSRRLDDIEKTVNTWIRAAIARTPQPRVEFQLHELADIAPVATDLEVRIFWGGRFVGRLREARRVITAGGLGDETSERRETVFFQQEFQVLLFFRCKQNWRNLPELYLEVWGQLNQHQEALIGEIRLFDDEILLQPKDRPAQVAFIRRLEGDYCLKHAAYRKLQGFARCSFTQLDIPQNIPFILRLPNPHLCLAFMDLRYDFANESDLVRMTGIFCRVFWRRVQVAQTQPAKSALKPKWTVYDTFVMPITSEAEHPGISYTIPLSIEVFRTVKNGTFELIGTAVPFDGKLRPFPTPYYPYDVLEPGSTSDEEKPVAQLGLAIHVNYLDGDKESIQRLEKIKAEKPKQEPEIEAKEASRVVTAEDVNSIYTAAAATQEKRKRKFSVISALIKTEDAAHQLFIEAREIAKLQPHDRVLKHYVKALEGEYLRAKKATKEAKIRDNRLGEHVHVRIDGFKPTTRVPAKRKMNRKELAFKPTRELKDDAPKAISLIPRRAVPLTIEEGVRLVTENKAGQEGDNPEDDNPANPALESALALLGNPRLSPPFPVLQPSVFLRIETIKGLENVGLIFRSKPRVHIFWCDCKVGETEEGTVLEGQQAAYSWEEQVGFLLPLPAAINLANLRLEVWAGKEFGGEVLIEGHELAHEYVDLQAPGGRYATSYQLMPKEYSNKANTFGKLSFYLVPLQIAQYQAIFDDLTTYLNDSMRAAIGDEAEFARLPVPGENAFLLHPSNLNFINMSYLWRRIMFKLQILGASNLPKGTLLDEIDPKVVVSCQGVEICRTKAIDNTRNPIFRDGVFDVPFKCVVGDEEAWEVLIQVFDDNSIGKDTLVASAVLKPSDLRELLGRVTSYPLGLVAGKAAQRSKLDIVDPLEQEQVTSVQCGAYLIRKPPGKSRFELQILSLTELVERPSVMSKAVTLAIYWNGQQVAQLEGQLSKVGALRLEKEVVELPFECQELEQREFTDFPTKLRIDVFAGSYKSSDKLKFLGQLETSGPFGLVVNAEEQTAGSVQYRTATYRLTSRPYTLDPVDKSELQWVGGRITLQVLLCEPTELAFAWYEEMIKLEYESKKTQVLVYDAVNLPANVDGGPPCSPLAIVYFNNREIGRTNMIKSCSFPYWGGSNPLLVPLQNITTDNAEDQLCVEIHHGSSTPTRFLGQVIVPAEQLYNPPLHKVDYLLSKRPFGPSKQQDMVQGSLSILMDLKENTKEADDSMKALFDTQTLLQAERDGGMHPHRWINLHIGQSMELKRGKDGSSKMDTYCMIIWKRQTIHKTAVINKKANPVFNETFQLSYEPEDMSLTDLELRILVMSKSSSRSDSFLGQLVLSGEQLMNRNDHLAPRQLTHRPDVPSDSPELITGSLEIYVRPEVEVPFPNIMRGMQLMLADSYFALDVVLVEDRTLLAGNGDEPPDAPEIFVKLSYDNQEFAQTTPVPLLRGEARFPNGLFIFPLSPETSHDRTLYLFDLTEPLLISVYANMKRSEHEGRAERESKGDRWSRGDRWSKNESESRSERDSRSERQTLDKQSFAQHSYAKHLGTFQLDAKCFKECPLFQARHILTLPQESSLLAPVIPFHRVSIDSPFRRKSMDAMVPPSSIVIRTAFFEQANPWLIEIGKGVGTNLPPTRLRLRLGLLGLVVSETDSGMKSVGDKYHVDYTFCGSARGRCEVPISEYPNQQGSDTFLEEILFSLELEGSSLNDVELVLTVIREVTSPFGSASDIVGQVRNMHDCLSKRYFTYNILESLLMADPLDLASAKHITCSGL